MRTFAAKEKRPQPEESRARARSDDATRAPLPAAEEASRFAHDFTRTPLRAAPRGGGPEALPLTSRGDIYERQAARVSEQVMRSPEPLTPRARGGKN